MPRPQSLRTESLRTENLRTESARPQPGAEPQAGPGPHRLWEAEADEPWLDPSEDEAVLDAPTMEPSEEAGQATWNLAEYEGHEPWLIPEVPVPIWSDGSPAEAPGDGVEELPAEALSLVH